MKDYVRELEEGTISFLQKRAFTIAASKGFHAKPRSFGDACALIHSEVSEAFEAYRTTGHTKPTSQGAINPDGTVTLGKPEGVPSELADIVIRCLDTAEECGIDLESAILEKLAYNESRTHMHGGKKL